MLRHIIYSEFYIKPTHGTLVFKYYTLYKMHTHHTASAQEAKKIEPKHFCFQGTVAILDLTSIESTIFQVMFVDYYVYVLWISMILILDTEL